jgi:hypothetical protein
VISQAILGETQPSMQRPQEHVMLSEVNKGVDSFIKVGLIALKDLAPMIDTPKLF